MEQVKIRSARLVAVVLVAAVLAVTSVGQSFAQQATPSAGSGGTKTAVRCTVAPRDIDEVIAVWFDPTGAPIPTSLDETYIETMADAPAGAAVDDATVAAVSATMQQIFACFDVVQYARAFALMTERAIALFGTVVLDPDQFTPEGARQLLEAELAVTPAADGSLPPGSVPSTVSDAFDARLLDDGRVGAFFASEGSIAFALFVQNGDQWLLDELLFVMDAGTPVAE